MTPETLAFPPLERLAARWASLESGGLEHLTLEQTAAGVTATGVVTGAAEGHAFGAWYRLALDHRWQVKQLSIHLTDSRWIIATARTPGVWVDGDGQALEEFAGCLDVDLACTPFTNTLPIRRLPWRAGEGRDLDMLYVDFSTFEPRRDRQRYTCLGAGRFRYEGLASGFTAEIAIDRDGLVTDYPGLFKRLA